MKNKILPILCIFILISFIFINNNVFATETNTLIVDGYDMSSVYNIYSPEQAFFIFKYGDTEDYYIYKSAYLTEFKYNAIRKNGIEIASYGSDWYTNVGRS